MISYSTMHYLLITLDDDQSTNSWIEILVTLTVIVPVALIAALCYCSKYKGQVLTFSVIKENDSEI